MKLIYIIVCIILLFSCDSVDYFEEYRGTNLIENQDFDSDDWKLADDELYIQHNQIKGNIYRLSIPNLIQNGQFEESSLGPITFPFNEWTVYSGATASITDSGDEHQKTMEYDINPKIERLDYNLNNAVSDGFNKNDNYIIRFSIKSTTSTAFEIRDDSSPYPNKSWTVNESSQFIDFPTENITSLVTSQNNSNQYFSIGAMDTDVQTIQHGWFDDFRIIKANANHYITLNVPVTDNDRLDLIDGYYRFSVKVKNDGEISPVSLQMSLQSDNEPYKTTMITMLEDNWSEWTEIEIISEDAFMLSQVDDANIQLRIFPTDASLAGNNKDTDSILIKEPFLEFLPDGG